MSLATTSKLDSSLSFNIALTLAFTITLGCWSEVEYKEPEKTEVEQPEADSTVTAPTEPEPSTTNEQPTTENESMPVADSTPTVEAEPPTEPPASPPTESLTFEEWLSTAEPPTDESPSSDEPPAAETPTLPRSTPSVGDRYAPTTPPALTESHVATEPESPPEETATSPAEESPTTPAESTPTPLPWELPEETPEMKTSELETTDTETSEATTPESTEPSEEPFTEAAILPESPPPVEESPPMEPAPMTEPAMEEPSVPESSTIVLSPAEPESPPEVAPLPPLDPQNSRNLAWLLGSKWSLWLLSEHAGAPASERDKFSQESETVAKAIGIELPSTPPYAASKPTAAFLESVLPLGRELGASIGKKLGPEEMALFEASTKSNLLLVLGDSRPDLIPAVLRAVTDAANRANLPDELLQPFTTALAGSPTTEQVDRAVYDFHRMVEESLRAPSDKP